MATRKTTRNKRRAKGGNDRKVASEGHDHPSLLEGGGEFSFGPAYSLSHRSKTFVVPSVNLSAARGRRGARVLMPHRFLSRGSYGLVVEYYVSSPSPAVATLGERFAMKIEDNAVIQGGEHDIVRTLENVRCDQIRGRAVGLHKYRDSDGKERTGVFTLYELMDGDLHRHRERVLLDYAAFHGLSSKYEAAVYVAEEVRAQLVCLYSNDPRHVYADLKLQNVLFKRTSSGRVRISVGDLGSMVPRAGDRYVMTFPCPPNIYVRTFATADEKLACLSYQVGVLFASLIGIDPTLLRFDKLRSRRGRIRQLRVALRDAVARFLPAYASRRLSTLVHENVAERRSVLLPLVGSRPGRLLPLVGSRPGRRVTAESRIKRRTAPCRICGTIFMMQTLNKYDGRTCGRCYRKLTATSSAGK